MLTRLGTGKHKHFGSRRVPESTRRAIQVPPASAAPGLFTPEGVVIPGYNGRTRVGKRSGAFGIQTIPIHAAIAAKSAPVQLELALDNAPPGFLSVDLAIALQAGSKSIAERVEVVRWLRVS